MNKYQKFDFKKFSLGQEKCAMKIGTDGILLGAWVDVNSPAAVNILDVGCGSGLISLMIAQRNPYASIKGIDIEDGAVEQAKDNVDESSWAKAIQIEKSPLQEVKSDVEYDIIVSNPPFFKNSLKSDADERNSARHTDTLSLSDLFQNSARLLKSGGKLFMIYPFDQLEDIYKIAALHDFYLVKQRTVGHNVNKSPKRVLLSFSYQQKPEKVIKKPFYIRQPHSNEYSDEYIELTKDFHPFL
ncbi:methyltransferase [Flammeovirga sp. SubArs3]|uniref:tRNA1(Val) (adenine(37)-N6)-methyltransferase n=1 Tax=Flammeovirga sp. SubArs3 TaxID=2995316 RepID=UPI00248BDE88|nr:methyltransferase [Flammeovirga sp. SubArs3]